MAAIGDVDEANSAVGVALTLLDAADLVAASLARVQNELFDLGADIATPDGIEGALRIIPGQVLRLEEEIDALNADLPPLTSFILAALRQWRRCTWRARWSAGPSEARLRWPVRKASIPTRSLISIASPTCCSSPPATLRRGRAEMCCGSRERRAVPDRFDHGTFAAAAG